MDKIVYRRLRKEDYCSIEDLICKSFGLYRYMPNAKVLKHFKKTYLQSCLAEQTYCRVAEKDGVVVGILMGKVNKAYHPEKHILPAVLWMWHSICMKIMALSSDCSTKDFDNLHKVYRQFLVGRMEQYDGVLTLFAVDENCRGMGIGKELLQGLEKYYQDFDIKRIYLFTDSTCNTGFYDSHGFTCADEEVIQVTRDSQKVDLRVFLYEKSF